jgi:cell filamentation protein
MRSRVYLYCYKDSNVLRNKFGLRDAEKLKKVETDFSAARQTDLLNHPVPGRFTAGHLCAIHQYLLGDIYTFAGHFRREDIAKGDTRFLSHREIKRKLSKLIDELHGEKYLSDSDRKILVSRSAYYMAELNYIHPFRDGNGRAIREFMRVLYLKNGYKVNWALVSIDELITAMTDSVYDTGLLEQILDKCLIKEFR